jgi:hypothetical protein
MLATNTPHVAAGEEKACVRVQIIRNDFCRNCRNVEFLPVEISTSKNDFEDYPEKAYVLILVEFLLCLCLYRSSCLYSAAESNTLLQTSITLIVSARPLSHVIIVHVR